MHDVQYRYTPFGYITIRNEGDVDHQIDERIDKWYRNYVAHTNSHLNYKVLRLDVLRAAYEYFTPFGGFENWVQFQLKEARLTTLQERFLQDTLKFIQTGRRDIDISGWEMLLVQDFKYREKEKQYITPIHQQTWRKKLAPRIKADNGLATWLTRQNGFLDMLWTLKILFATSTEGV